MSNTDHSEKSWASDNLSHTIASPYYLDTDNSPRPDRIGKDYGEGSVWVGYRAGMGAGRFELTSVEARIFAAQLMAAADAVDGLK